MDSARELDAPTAPCRCRLTGRAMARSALTCIAAREDPRQRPTPRPVLGRP